MVLLRDLYFLEPSVQFDLGEECFLQMIAETINVCSYSIKKDLNRNSCILRCIQWQIS